MNREKIERALESTAGKAAIVFLIGVSAMTIGIETYPSMEASAGPWLHVVDKIILALFTVEIALRMYVTGSFKRYLQDPWNVFDFVIVSACYIPAAGTYLAVGRLLRVLRVLRLMTIFPSLRRLVEALLRSIPSMIHILGLLLLVMYIYAVIGTFLFREAMPEQYGTLHESLLCLFRVATMDGGLDIMFEGMKTHSWSWIYFISYIVLVAFIVVNLFVGVIVDSMSSARRDEEQDPNELILAELAVIRKMLMAAPYQQAPPPAGQRKEKISADHS
ncbi:MAG: ion transporter [Deltaproteobacteria bacterium]|nr:ion transporter [Deltaproteobacteria bacterium]